jgi:hypothetical protein
MPRKSTASTQPLHERLLDGFAYTRRPDGSVYTIKVEKKAVAEVCVGKKTIRLDVRPRAMSEANVASARALLLSLRPRSPRPPRRPLPARQQRRNSPQPRSARAVSRKVTAAA